MNTENMTFEMSMTRLEEIVKRMENGDVSLEESLELFQEGTALALSCGKLLDEAEMLVTKVCPNGNGEPVEEAFEHESEI